MSIPAVRRIAASAVVTAVLLGSVGAARASAAPLCTVPTVSGPVKAADGRVYTRGHNTWCSVTWRITIHLKKNGAIVNSNTAYYGSGDGGVGVFSAGSCTSGATYQGVAVVDGYYNGAWHQMSYGTSNAPARMC